MRKVMTLEELRTSFPFIASEIPVLYISYEKEVLASPVIIVDVGRNNITYRRMIDENNITCTASFTKYATGAELFYDMSVKESNSVERNVRNQQVQDLFRDQQYIRAKMDQMPEVLRGIITELTTKPKKPRERRESMDYLYR